MAALVGALRAMLTLDSTAFVDGAKKARKSQKQLETNMQQLARTMRNFSIGVAAAFSGLGLAIKGSLNIADEMGKASQKFGVPVEQLSRLKYAADLSDVSLATLGTSLGSLSKKMVAAANGGKAQAEMFAKMGVEVVDAAGKLRGTESVLQDVAGVFATMPDGAEKTALAMQLFGKAGRDMIPLLNSGKTGLQAMAEEANKLGVVIDSKTAKSAEAFNDNLTRLKNAMGGLVMQITAALAPTLERLSAFAVDVAKAFGELSPETRAMVVNLAGILGVVGLAAAGFGLLSLALSPVTIAIASVAAGAALIIDNWDEIAAWFSETWASITASTEEAWASIKASIGGAIDWVTQKWDAFVAKLQAAVQVAKDVGKSIADALSAGKVEMNDGTGYGGMGGAGDASGGDAFSGNSFSSNSYSTGRAGGNGLVDGWTAALAERMGEIAAAADGLTAKVRERWQVQSPSRVFREIGQFLSEGLSLGIKDNVPMVDAAMTEVGEAIDGRAESLKQKLESFRSTAQSAFAGLVTGAHSFKEALGQLAKSLADMLAQAAFQQLFSGMFKSGGVIANLFSGMFADGAAFSHGRVTAFASGGIVNGVTAFAMQSGLGVMGEAGPEAIMPLTRGPGGKLGVQAHGGGGQRIELVITEGEMFGARVEAIADGRAVSVVKRYDRDVAPQTRQRPGRERG